MLAATIANTNAICLWIMVDRLPLRVAAIIFELVPTIARKNVNYLTDSSRRFEEVLAVDALDRRILREVQRDCAMSAARLGERCGTTESTALRRLNRLRRMASSASEVAIVDGEKVGRGLLLFVSVRLEREDGSRGQGLCGTHSKRPDVLQFYFVTGTSTM